MSNQEDPKKKEQLEKDIELLNKLLSVEARKPGKAASLPAAIRIIDDRGALLRPPEVLFSAAEAGYEVFGWNVPNGALVKALRDATLPLGRFTLIVGANGTGKTTALKALELLNNSKKVTRENIISVSELRNRDEEVSLEIETTFGKKIAHWKDDNNGRRVEHPQSGMPTIENSPAKRKMLELRDKELESFKVFSFDPEKISQTVPISSEKDLKQNGENLAGILDLLKDTEPERWRELNDALEKWFPEFDQILFDRNDHGKYIVLRTKFGKHKIKAEDLSDGTRLALAYLTVAYLPNPPKIVAFEEPEKGIHPRLLRNIQEAMYRLAYPENFGEKREPIQVIATTHSPYLLDLYKDRREEIVIADKDEKGVHFQRLSELPHIEEILQGQDAPLGDVWFTGILGGVPVQP